MKQSRLWLGVVTLLPDMFAALEHGVTGRALKKELASVNLWNPRDYTHDTHHTVDDRPFGGGPGMVMKPEPIADAIKAARAAAPVGVKTIYLSPKGKRFDQRQALAACASPGLILVAGRYEGIDQRLIDTYVDEEWSLGDFVLSGGEFAAMAIIDSLLRLLPGSLGDNQSALQDSFMQGILDHPHYTRPDCFEGQTVPAVLRSGDHAAIANWRKKMALGLTWRKRPDLLEALSLSPEEKMLLDEFKKTLGE